MSWQAITRRAYIVSGALAVLALVALLVPATRTMGESGLIGTLVGVLNVRMLGSALVRGMALPGGGAKVTLTVSGVLRLVIVLGILAWAGLNLRHLEAVPLLVGVFAPEVVMVVGLLRGPEAGTGEKGDSP
jgi:uncharacterized membrane protein